MKRLLCCAWVLCGLSGCAVVPSTVIDKPLTVAKPLPVPPESEGAIYRVAAYRPLFEDKRARNVGDVITITISETNNASSTASSSGNKSGSVAAAIPTVMGLPLKTLQGTNIAGTTTNKMATADALTSANTFISTMSVTVVAVESSGLLEVSGEKQVSLDTGVEYIRFSGLVDPNLIQTGNIIPSTQVADARIEYRSDSRIDKASLMSAMSRFFQSLAPF